MLIPNKSGVACDYCTDELVGKFVYYSFNYGRVDVSTSKKYTTKLVEELSCDMCDKCLDELKAYIGKNNKQQSNLKLACDCCSTVMSGDFRYYYVKVSKAMVDLSDGKSSVDTDKDIINLVVCKSCYATVNEMTKSNKVRLRSKYESIGNWK